MKIHNHECAMFPLRTFVGKSWNHANEKLYWGGGGVLKICDKVKSGHGGIFDAVHSLNDKDSRNFGRTLRLRPEVWRDSKAIFCLEHKLKLFLKRVLQGEAANLSGWQQHEINRKTCVIRHKTAKGNWFLAQDTVSSPENLYTCGLERKLNIQIVVFWL